MGDLKTYLFLLDRFPSLFENPSENGVINIITDLESIKKLETIEKEKLRRQGLPERWMDIGVLSEDQWFYVVRDLVRFPNGQIGGYLRKINRKSVEGGYGVVIIVIQKGKVLLLKRFCHADRQWYWEFPRGFGEPGLTAEENAYKELQEEINADPRTLKKISVVENPDGNGGIAFFYAELPDDAKLNLDEGEGFNDIRFVSVNELENELISGKITDYYSIRSYLLTKIADIL
jgi:ADP-ribose pyrophosphatase